VEVKGGRSLLFTATLCTQETIGFPRGIGRAQEQIGQCQGIVERRGRAGERRGGIRILHLTNPRGAVGLDREPPRLARFPVVVPRHAAVSHQLRQLAEDVRLDGSDVNGDIGSDALLKADTFHLRQLHTRHRNHSLYAVPRDVENCRVVPPVWMEPAFETIGAPHDGEAERTAWRPRPEPLPAPVTRSGEREAVGTHKTPPSKRSAEHMIRGGSL